MTAEEIDAYRAQYTGSNKGLLDSFEFWLEFRPDVLKRHKARTRHYASALEPVHPLVELLGAIHQYTIMPSVRRRLRGAPGADQRRASHRHPRHALDCLRPLRAPRHVRGRLLQRLPARLRDPPAATERFPAGWTFDPNAFDSGMDYSTREASAEDMERLTDWYTRTLGEVPRYVGFLALHRPGLLKAYRDRYEHAIRDSLPCQMLPWMMLNYNVVRGFHEGSARTCCSAVRWE